VSRGGEKGSPRSALRKRAIASATGSRRRETAVLIREDRWQRGRYTAQVEMPKCSARRHEKKSTPAAAALFAAMRILMPLEYRRELPPARRVVAVVTSSREQEQATLPPFCLPLPCQVRHSKCVVQSGRQVGCWGSGVVWRGGRQWQLCGAYRVVVLVQVAWRRQRVCAVVRVRAVGGRC